MENHERREIERLIESDEELDRLWKEHQAFESRIEELDSRPHLNESESQERVRLKKLKLAGKDRIAAILRT